MSKVLFILASKDFRDPEFFIPSGILEKAGHQIFKASDVNKGETASGKEGGSTVIDLNIKEVDPENFDMIVFVGGSGALEHLDNETSYAIARKTVEAGKFLAAICIAPVILARSGVLKNKNATVFSSAERPEPIGILAEKGAVYRPETVVSDGSLITANGPKAAKDFGRTLLKMLE